MAGRPNHWLDCHVYNTAAQEKLMLDTLTDADWAALRAERYGAKNEAQPGLFDGPPIATAATPQATATNNPPPAAPPREPAYLDAGSDYL